MDPFDVVRMAKLIGIDLVALTDHNSAKNCPAAEAAAKECGIGFIPGIEVTTSEEIHCVCLFPSTGHAMSFSEYIAPLRPRIKNRPDVFGNQCIVRPDGSVEEEEFLLFPATDLSIMKLPGVVLVHEGLFWPAHVDRGTNSLFTMLGSWPRELRADAVEICSADPGGVPVSLKRLAVSDAHRFESMKEDGFPLPLETADFNGLAKYLRGASSC
jgi:hypothetical protein